MDPTWCSKHGFVDFRNRPDFAFRWSETDGFNTSFRGKMSVPTAELPPYATVIYHGYGRNDQLAVPWVAIPLYAVVHSRKSGEFTCIVNDGEKLRQTFRIADKTKIIITSVAPDKYLEQFWKFHRTMKIAEQLFGLDVQAITVPNFSYFYDAPPAHAVYNHARMMRIAERFSDVGLPVIPHLNGFHDNQWKAWAPFLRCQTNVVYICKEFQTGLRSSSKGERAYTRLVRLQDEVGRHLHPILIAGQRYAPKAARDFKSFTVIDSAPFLKTFSRQFLDGADQNGFKWKVSKTPRGMPLDDRLSIVLKSYEDALAQKADGGRLKQETLGLRCFKPPPERQLPPQTPVSSYELFAGDPEHVERKELQTQRRLTGNSSTRFLSEIAKTRAADSVLEIAEKSLAPR
jgi:hypothetical protein